MSKYQNFIRDFIDSIGEGDNVSAQRDFDLAMSSKIGDALEAKRVEIAKHFVTKQADEEV